MREYYKKKYGVPFVSLTDGEFYTAVEPYYEPLEFMLVYCWLCGCYKPLSEMGKVACKECEDESEA